MCEECKSKHAVHPRASLILWFGAITTLMVALAHWA